MTVLIVDDEAPAALSLQRVVEQVLGAGTRILTARDGKGALALAAKSRPDLAFLDVQMPGMNGGWRTGTGRSTSSLSRHIPNMPCPPGSSM